MSVTELPQRGPGGPGPGSDRTPPQDVAAEQSVLGGMMLSKDAIADVVEVVRAGDFYRPAHETVFDTVLDLYTRGEPADPVTVAAELQRRGELGRVGGAPYLHTLVNSVPTAANAGYYAEIVRERAVLRRLVEAGTRIVQLGYAGDGEVDDVVDRAQAEVYAVTERRTSEDYRALSEIMEGTLDEIEAIGSRGGQLVGVPTGFHDLDEVTNGLHAGQMVVVAGRPGSGKALALDTPLVTPTGWTTMGEVAVGEELFGSDGRPTRVVAATEVMLGRPCFEVEFSDGSTVVADAEHEWRTTTRASRRARAERPEGLGRCEVVTTADLLVRVHRAPVRPRPAVPVARPLQLPAGRLPLSAYVLGVSLASGGSTDPDLERRDPELAAQVAVEGVPLADARALLQELGVAEDPHVLDVYLRGSEQQRRDLLAGLLDARGALTSSGGVVLTVAHERLARDVHELVVSLGYRATVRTRRVRGRDESRSTCFAVAFTPTDKVFRLSRKLQRQRLGGVRVGSRYVTAVRAVPSVPVRCVQVDSADSTYLAGRSMVPTHNSTLGLDISRSASIRHGLTSVIFSLEMSRNEIAMRLLSAEARVTLQHMRTGHMTDDDWTRIARKTGEVSSAPLFIDDSPNMSLTEIRAKCRRLKQRHDLRLVVLDYLQLLTSGRKVESRQVEVSEFSRSLKLLAKELEVPVVVLSQLNRGPEQRTDKRPLLADLRECLTGDTLITRADTGARVPMRALVGQRDVPVWSLDEQLRLRRSVMSDVWSTGTRPTWDVALASGRRITATANHPFLTVEGWSTVDALRVGDHLATVAQVPASTGAEPSRHVPDADVDLLPAQTWPLVQKAMRERGISAEQLAGRLGTPDLGEVVSRSGLSRRRMAAVAAAVPDPHLAMLATSDVRWDRIVAIDPAGDQEVFDAHVPVTHSFLANDVVSHNSGAIEQDSDIVILLHREDMYEKESPRAGEADLILAKHRNGPTTTVTVAFQGHVSRFADMAVGG